MGHFQLRRDGILAQVRLGAVARDRGRVLLHRPYLGDGPWAVPGGRLEVGETAREGLAREFREELGVDVTVGALLCTVENFFDHAPLDGPPPRLGAPQPPAIRHHELGLYFAVEVPPSLGERTTVEGTEGAGSPDEHRLEFRWVEQELLPDLDVRPTGLVPWLGADAPPPGALVTVAAGETA